MSNDQSGISLAIAFEKCFYSFIFGLLPQLMKEKERVGEDMQ